MTTGRKVEAWAVLNLDGSLWALCFTRPAALFEAADANLPNSSVVRLVEHDPRAVGVLRAALKWLRNVNITGDTGAKLQSAIARYDNKRKR